MTCARCGCGVYRAEDQVIMTKVWHKCCFRCGNCNSLLNKCSARLFQGDIFCELCHDMILDDLEAISPSPVYNTCRVVSSPSCICIKEDTQRIKNSPTSPTFNYCKKYDIHIPPDAKKCSPKAIKSCSCIPDPDKEKSYCFAFPIPREVANYYNRINMRRKSRQGIPKHFSCEERPVQPPRRLEKGPCITIRTVSPPRKHRSSNKCFGNSTEVQDYPARCCCRQSPTHLSTNCSCCLNNTLPCTRQECTCHSRTYSPIRRNTSPPRKCPPQHCSYCCSEYLRNIRQCSPNRRLSSDPDLADHKSHAGYPDCPKCKEFSKCGKCHYRDQKYSDNCHRSDPLENIKDRTICQYPSGLQCGCPIHGKSSCKKYDNTEKVIQHCVCGKLNPCNCKLKQIRDECTSICVRCNRKVYAAEKICISSGPFHTSCFSCYCCHKLLDVKNVFEHKGEIYCKNCYNSYLGNQYYGYGASQCC